MTAAAPPSDPVARLREAADAAAGIGLAEEGARARETADRIAARLGFPGDTYVLALAGGTGVGKSSLLNALAGRTVSAVRAVRPTTDEPIAFVSADRRRELAPLLEWLGVRRVADHANPALADVAILDLPDVDSVRGEHRATVDELLPRIDAIAWVVDPEKYDDERLHEYWRGLRAHADRMRFVLNKADRLSEDEREAVARDLAGRLVDDGLPQPVVHVVSASQGDGIAAFRDELARAADAKAVIAAKLEVERRTAAERLASCLGLRAGQPTSLVRDDRRHAAVEDAVRGALALVDPPGLGRQVQAAVLNRARTTGGSLLGRAVAVLTWMTGNRRRRADPAGYLVAWRQRGALGRVMNPVRALLLEAAGGVAPAARAPVLEALGAQDADAALERALDEVTRREAAELRIRSSLLWPVIGLLQLVVGAVFLFAIAWYATLFLAGGALAVGTVEAPWLGPVPMPLALLAASVAVSAVLGWILGLHAGWVGRRLAARVRDRTAEAVRAAITAVALAGLTRVEAARAVVANALRGGGGSPG